MYSCQKCKKEFNLKNAKSSHEKYCDGNGIKKRRGPKYIRCDKCNEDVISQGYKKHYNSCIGNGILNNKRYTGKGQPLKDKSYIEFYGIEKAIVKKAIISKSILGRKSSKKTCKKISDSLKGKTGGIRKGGGRGKKGWYKNFWCDSSWELAWIIYQLDHNIEFKRNKEGFDYIFKNEKHKYYPDFILLDSDEYIEIKGYLTEKVKEKIKQFPYKLNILDKNSIKPYLKYAKQIYGENFIELYKEDKIDRDLSPFGKRVDQ
jgi:hypothetical protein